MCFIHFESTQLEYSCQNQQYPPWLHQSSIILLSISMGDLIVCTPKVQLRKSYVGENKTSNFQNLSRHQVNCKWISLIRSFKNNTQQKDTHSKSTAWRFFQVAEFNIRIHSSTTKVFQPWEYRKGLAYQLTMWQRQILYQHCFNTQITGMHAARFILQNLL